MPQCKEILLWKNMWKKKALGAKTGQPQLFYCRLKKAKVLFPYLFIKSICCPSRLEILSDLQDLNLCFNNILDVIIQFQLLPPFSPQPFLKKKFGLCTMFGI